MSSSELSDSSPVTLDVGGRKFRTTGATLWYSNYFQALLGRWENSSDKQADGSLFVDVNPDVFQHILNFMRHPLMFPLFWTKKAGFNYTLYMKVEAQADFFQLLDLRDWIRSKRYLDAVKVHVENKRLNHRNFDNATKRTTPGSDLQVQSFFGSYSGVKEFRSACPLHPRRYESACSRCEETLQKHGPTFDEPERELTQVVTRTVFDDSVCRNPNVAQSFPLSWCVTL